MVRVIKFKENGLLRQKEDNLNSGRRRVRSYLRSKERRVNRKYSEVIETRMEARDTL